MNQRKLGQIIILNGAPRSGKSTIAHAISETFDGVWMNLGVDGFQAMLGPRHRPGIGLRPGGEAPELEPVVEALYLALYDAIAAHSRRGIQVVVDVGHHDDYQMPRHIFPRCCRILSGLPVLVVGVWCPLTIIMARRKATWQQDYAEDGQVPEPVKRWQTSVHQPGIYDLTLDTSRESVKQCLRRIGERLDSPEVPDACRRIAAIDGKHCVGQKP